MHATAYSRILSVLIVFQGKFVPHRQSLIEDLRWQLAAQIDTTVLSEDTRDWLLDGSSLSARLDAISDGHFTVARLYQGWHTALPSERQLLQMGEHKHALIREVELRCHGLPVVFARSVFPAESLTGSLAHLRELNNESLGSFLFANPAMRRTPFEVAYLTGHHSYLPVHLQQDLPCWGRRSRFTIDDKPLLVSEVFLQGFTPWPTHGSHPSLERGKIGTH